MKTKHFCVSLITFATILVQPSSGAEQNRAGKSVSTSSESLEKKLSQLQKEVRQGNDKNARSIIRSLSGSVVKPDEQTTFRLSETCDFLIGKEKWDLSKLYLEELPVCKPGWGYVLIRHWCSEAKQNTKTLDAIDSWIKARLPANPDYWCSVRCVFAQETGRKIQVLDELARQVKSEPKNLDELKRFLEANDALNGTGNIDWICKTVNPDLAYDNYRIAEWLHMRNPKPAIHYLKRAREITFTRRDKEAITKYVLSHSARAFFQVDVQNEFSIWVRSMLAECYEKTGRHKAAQELLLNLSKENGGTAPSYALTQLAGKVQAHTPTHPLEKQIKAAETENKNSITYWTGRADYYRGRGDVAQERDAYLKALKIAKSRAADDNSIFSLALVVSNYSRFLKNHEGDKAAIAFLWSEFDANSNVEFRKRVVQNVNDFETDQTHYLGPTDERLWKWLQQSKTWSYSEERILWRMARNASADQKETFWTRAEALAKGNTSRELTLGWIMNRTSEPKRSLPHLKFASTSPDREEQERAAFTLFESCLDTNDWTQAEQIWPRASARLTDNEKPDWLGRIALAAARSGDRDNAMRLWKIKDQTDFSMLGQLDEMAKYGMRDDFIKYYGDLKKKMPDSTVPDSAIKLLKK